MKNTILLLVIGCCSYASFCQTQSQMNNRSGDGTKKAERKMDDVYKKILKIYAKDTLFVKNLKLSQKLWLQYSNAQLKAMFPDYGPGYYGSMHAMCVATYSKKLAEQRMHELELWLIGNEEEDGCDGSIKMKSELPVYSPN